MKTTISQLFDAIHYCNKFVKTENCTDSLFKKDFYSKKRDLIYHMVKYHKQFQIAIDECRIDMQNSQVENSLIKLYAFRLTHDGTELKVHQKSCSKLDSLFAFHNIVFEETGEYTYTPDEDLEYNHDNTEKAISIINKFHKKWGLHNIINHLGDKFASYPTVYNSFVYFFPDFTFSVDDDTKIIKKNTIIHIKHKKSGRNYKLEMVALKKCGDYLLPLWRKKDVKTKKCL